MKKKANLRHEDVISFAGVQTNSSFSSPWKKKMLASPQFLSTDAENGNGCYFVLAFCYHVITK